MRSAPQGLDPVPQTPSTDELRRTARYEIRNRLRTLAHAGLTQPSPSVGKCGLPLTKGVGVRHRAESGGFRGIQHCGSVWTCPNCAARIGAHRAQELAAGIDAHLANDGGVVMVTVTVRHKATDSLKKVRRAVVSAWSAATSGCVWKDHREMIGLVGYTRSAEVTHGENGWHLHFHVLWFLDRPFSADTAEGIRVAATAMFDRWAAAAVREGLKRPKQSIGLNVTPAIISNPEDPEDRALVAEQNADYNTKAASDAEELVDVIVKARTAGTKLATEAIRADMKSGRNGNRTPWQLLAGLLTEGVIDEEDLETWNEYERDIKGLRQMVWSRNLRDYFRELQADIAETEQSDEEIVNTEEDEGETIGVIHSGDYLRTLRSNPEIIAAIATAAGDPSVVSARSAVAALCHKHGLRFTTDRREIEAFEAQLRRHWRELGKRNRKRRGDDD